jgi:hypothetical protein
MHHALRVTRQAAAGWLLFLISTTGSGLSLAQPTEPRSASSDAAQAAQAPPAPQPGEAKTAKHSLSRYPDTMPASAPQSPSPQTTNPPAGPREPGGSIDSSGTSAAAGPGGPADMRGEPARKQPLR